MVVCMDDTAMQLVLMVLIIDHLTVVYQGLDACNKILGVLSQPGYNIFEFSKVHMGVDNVCHSLVYSVKEGRCFHLGYSLFLFATSRHQLHMHLQGFGSQSSKDISEVVLAVRHDVVEEEPVLQGTLKYKEWYASFESQSYMGRLMDAVLAVSVLAMALAVALADCVMSCCGVGSKAMYLLLDSAPGWSDNGLIRKNWGVGYKNSCNSGTISLIYFKLGQKVDDALPLDDIVFMPMISQGVHRCTKNGIRLPRVHFLFISCPKTLKNKER